MNYKLIKEYPDCDMTVGQEVAPFRDFYRQVGGKGYCKGASSIEGYPEFWEPVLPVFKTTDGVEVTFNKPIELFCINLNSYNIYSFYRESAPEWDRGFYSSREAAEKAAEVFLREKLKSKMNTMNYKELRDALNVRV